jgi:hypothetical protein
MDHRVDPHAVVKHDLDEGALRVEAWGVSRSAPSDRDPRTR